MCVQLAFMQRAEGFFKGASDETILVANAEDWHSNTLDRFVEDEPVRRRLLELVVRPWLLHTCTSFNCAGII